jgi:hypothetical protein
MSEDGLAGPLFLKRDGGVGVSGQWDLPPLDAGNEAKIDQADVIIVRTSVAVSLRQTGAAAVNFLDGAGVDPGGADHLNARDNRIAGHFFFLRSCVFCD